MIDNALVEFEPITIDSIFELIKRAEEIPKPSPLPIQFHQSKYLPKTIKDADGNEFELLGVALPAIDPTKLMDPDYSPGPIQLLCGKKVEQSDIPQTAMAR